MNTTNGTRNGHAVPTDVVIEALLSEVRRLASRVATLEGRYGCEEDQR
jgi:hypothetical protein